MPHVSAMAGSKLPTISGNDLSALRDDVFSKSGSIYVANDVVSHVAVLVEKATNAKLRPVLFPRPEEGTRAKIYDLAEWWAAVQKRSGRRADAFAFAIVTGLRRDEILAIRRSDIHGGWLDVRNPKGGPTRRFWRHLPTQARQILARQLNTSDRVFPFAGLRLAGLPGTHAVRKVFATALENELKADRTITKKLLNHVVRSDVTDHYIDDDRDQLAAWSQRIADLMARKARLTKCTPALP